MARRGPGKPSEKTIKRLFASSGNRCAFPKCTFKVVHHKSILGKICHIKAASPNGPRYDPTQTQAERHAYENLILLCGGHHTLVDDDPETYTVEALVKMKADHENHSSAITAKEIEHAARLLAEEAATEARRPAGGAIPRSTATAPAALDRGALIARARDFHRQRVAAIAAGSGPVGLLDGGALILHAVPLGALNGRATAAFAKISSNPDRFPTIADNIARRSKVTHGGLLIGSNADGLSKPQRAYVRVSRDGIVESVASSLARGRRHDSVMLPQLQAMVIKYGCIYANSLSTLGVAPPYAIFASLVGVNGMRLLHDFIPTGAFPEDMPFAALTDDPIHFDEAVFEIAPGNYNACAKLLEPIVTHLANTAGLPASPYFDEQGNYLLNL